MFFFSSRRRHTSCGRDWSSDVCSSDLCAFTNSVDVEKETMTFLDAAEAFAKSSEPEKAGEVRAKAYEFCKDQHALGEPVAIEALSSYLDDSQPERFKEFASKNAEMPETG